MLDTVKALEEARQEGEITVTQGTKGGLKRIVQIQHDEQIEILARMEDIQGNARCPMSPELSWIQWKNAELRQCREILKTHGIGGYRELRSSYASIRYEQLTGHLSPCNGGPIADKGIVEGQEGDSRRTWTFTSPDNVGIHWRPRSASGMLSAGYST